MRRHGMNTRYSRTCMHARTHARTRARTRTNKRTGVRTCTCSHVHTCTAARMHTRTHARPHAWTHVRTCLHVRTCMCARVHARTHTRTHARVDEYSRPMYYLRSETEFAGALYVSAIWDLHYQNCWIPVCDGARVQPDDRWSRFSKKIKFLKNWIYL